ncbi:MAG TPA: hypothetical protein VG826_35695 [Pirellulales bacterium]|nr:hypothetical protein [Pirellulales bacterium]
MSTVLSHVEMHSDHKQWTSKETLWEDEARIWLNEIDAALADAKKLETVLREHRTAMEAHVEKVGGLRQGRAAHEHALAEYEKGGCGEDLIAMAPKHEQEAEKHYQLYQEHERVKRHHYTALAYWQLFLRAMSREM